MRSTARTWPAIDRSRAERSLRTSCSTEPSYPRGRGSMPPYARLVPRAGRAGGRMGTPLFSERAEDAAARDKPLAARMRPRDLDEFVGQAQIVGEGRVLRRADRKSVV